MVAIIWSPDLTPNFSVTRRRFARDLQNASTLRVMWLDGFSSPRR
jgi:hypothetical protein